MLSLRSQVLMYLFGTNSSVRVKSLNDFDQQNVESILHVKQLNNMFASANNEHKTDTIFFVIAVASNVGHCTSCRDTDELDA
jgi:hypothetical protein